MSIVGQVLGGYRLIGELLIQSAFSVSGLAPAFHLALRPSRSVVASFATTLVALVLPPATPALNDPKLFFCPLEAWVSWRYVDRPIAVRAAVPGVATAAAFLFRHDHGLYVGAGAVLPVAMAWPVVFAVWIGAVAVEHEIGPVVYQPDVDVSSKPGERGYGLGVGRQHIERPRFGSVHRVVGGAVQDEPGSPVPHPQP